jgi:hypothetical protein
MAEETPTFLIIFFTYVILLMALLLLDAIFGIRLSEGFLADSPHEL